ncbi:unnamed protein product [Sphagnum balticum]
MPSSIPYGPGYANVTFVPSSQASGAFASYQIGCQANFSQSVADSCPGFTPPAVSSTGIANVSSSSSASMINISSSTSETGMNFNSSSSSSGGEAPPEDDTIMAIVILVIIVIAVIIIIAVLLYVYRASLPCFTNKSSYESDESFIDNDNNNSEQSTGAGFSRL